MQLGTRSSLNVWLEQMATSCRCVSTQMIYTRPFLRQICGRMTQLQVTLAVVHFLKLLCFMLWVRRLVTGLSSWLVSGLSSRLITGLSSLLVTGQSSRLVVGLSSRLITGLSSRLATGVSSRLVAGLSSLLIIGLSSLLVTGQSSRLVVGLSSRLITGLSSRLATGLSSRLVAGVSSRRLGFCPRPARMGFMVVTEDSSIYNRRNRIIAADQGC
jgi:hypothetical protein